MNAEESISTASHRNVRRETDDTLSLPHPRNLKPRNSLDIMIPRTPIILVLPQPRALMPRTAHIKGVQDPPPLALFGGSDREGVLVVIVVEGVDRRGGPERLHDDAVDLLVGFLIRSPLIESCVDF